MTDANKLSIMTTPAFIHTAVEELQSPDSRPHPAAMAYHSPVPKSPAMNQHSATLIKPDSFESDRHFYPRVLNANLHPMVASFFQLGNRAIATRFCHLHPNVNQDRLLEVLNRKTHLFQWAGADLFNVTNHSGQRQMIVIETNSCPSGQKSMPQLSHDSNNDGYHTLMRAFIALLRKREDPKEIASMHSLHSKYPLPKGVLAVVFDKNPMENLGYAGALADVANEDVYAVQFHEDDEDPPVRFYEKDETSGRIMQIRMKDGEWKDVRGAFRYVTQRPWTRVPITSATFIMNPIIACLAGGRNKLVADKAYEIFNKEQQLTQSGLEIRAPTTVRDVNKNEVPLWVRSMGGHAVVKIPYSNAGQGVYTITNERELQAFMAEPHRYDKFIVQSLVGNSHWSSVTSSGQFFHTGTIPNKRHETFVCDLRMMVTSTATGFQPVSMYARRALQPLPDTLTESSDSWEILGTNLSVKKSDGQWSTEPERLMMMDMKDFNRLGLGIDDLIDAYIQTVLATAAIDQMAVRLMREDGSFDVELYKSLNSDPALLAEVMY